LGVRLTDQEIDEFLSQHPVATLITIGNDGAPRPTPLWFANDGPVVYFGTRASSPKVANIRSDNRVAVQVETGDHYLTLKAVLIWGKAYIVDDKDELEMVARKMGEKYAHRRPPVQAFGEATKRHYSGERVTIKVVPEKIRTWDNAKLRLKTPVEGGAE